MKRVVLEIRIDPAGIELLRGSTEVVEAFGDHQAVLASLEGGAHALITSSALKVTAEIMANSPSLQVVGRPGIGVDTVDLGGATENGVMVVNTPDAPTESTAEHAVALLLDLAKHIRLGDRDIRESGWAKRGTHVGVEVLGKTLGVVGLGRIGKRVAEICGKGLGMRVIGFDPYVSQDQVAALGVEMQPSLESVLRASDFLTIHTPLILATRGLIGAKELAMLKPTAYLINVARGPIVDEDALLQTLRREAIAGAGVDVFKIEPIPFPHPLLELENVIATPHFASQTDQGRYKMGTGVVEQVLVALRGERPNNLVNSDVWGTRARKARS